ncbi:hypothetical protein F5141DRAFT_1066767 [Pisolithus sp. B1]|nr:hypothetical protein F5141DRAFT_1066767 [Pisolithus sp. B1]
MCTLDQSWSIQVKPEIDFFKTLQWFYINAWRSILKIHVKLALSSDISQFHIDFTTAPQAEFENCTWSIPSSQGAPASMQAKECCVTEPASLGHLTLGVTINRLKPCWLVEPPKGWEEHMFGLRDRRHSLTPFASSTGALHLSSPSMLQQGQTHNENTMMDEVEQQSMDNEDGSKSNNKEGSEEGSKGSTEGSDYAENKESLSNCKGHSDHEMPPPYLKKPGNLSKVALEEIQAFVKDIKATAQELGKWHGQSTYDILVTVGFGVKPSHTKINEVNLFHSWYWAMQPKPAGVNKDTLNNLITKEYNTLMQDILKDDIAMRREKLQAVYEWSESSSVVPANQSVKSIAARVNSTKTQFSGLAEAWSNLEDIKIIGVVMYVRQDPAGCQTSGIFGGSEVIRNFINEHGVDVQALMDKCVRNSDGTEAGLLSTGSAGDVALALELHLTHGIEASDPQKVTWHWLLEFMQRYHLTIINWPCGISPLGPGFDHKKLKAGPLHQLVVLYLLRKLGHMYDGQTDDKEEQDSLDDVHKIEIKCWNHDHMFSFFADIIDIPDENPLKSEIPLVKAANGTVLQKIWDDPE